MTDLMLKLPEWEGRELSFIQAIKLSILVRESDGMWHFNDCGCCITVHVDDGAYVIGRDGEKDFYPDDHS